MAVEKSNKELAVELMTAYLNFLGTSNTGTRGGPQTSSKPIDIIDWTMEFERRLSGGERTDSPKTKNLETEE